MKRVLIAGGLVTVLMGCSSKQESYTVEKTDLIESVYSSIIVEPAQKYLIQSGSNGYIDLIAFQEGDTVTPDEILFKLRDENTLANAENAQLSYSLAEAYYRGELNQLEDIELELQTAKSKYELDSVNFSRIKKLNQRSLSSDQELENAQLQLDNSRNKWKIVVNQRRRLQRELQTKMQQARNTAINSSARLNDLFVRSQISGMIYELYKEQGEYVTVKEPLAVVGSSNDFTLKMRIDEVDIMRVKEGQNIVVSLESFPGKVFEAVVTRIIPKLEDQTQTFVVEGKFADQPDKLYYGLTGEGNIIVRKTSGVLVVPLEYINANGEVITENGPKKVKLGNQNLSVVEVLEGVHEGMKILKPTE